MEGDLAGRHPRDAVAVDDADATRFKPPTVSGSAPRQVAPVDAADDTQDRPRVSSLVWALVGTGVLTAVGVLLYVALGNGPARDTGVEPTPTAPVSTGIGPDVPDTAPLLSGDRTGRNGRFSWRVEESIPGDTWQWRRTDTGEGGRTPADSLVLTSPDRVCLQVRLIRGQFASPWADECVD